MSLTHVVTVMYLIFFACNTVKPSLHLMNASTIYKYMDRSGLTFENMRLFLSIQPNNL